MKRRLVTLLVICFAFLGIATMSAHASDNPPAKCFQANAAGDLPTCTEEGNHWVVSYDGDGSGDPGLGDGSGGGIPGWFVGLFVLAGVAGVGVTIWRVSMARGIARQAGMSPNTATAVTLLGNDGLDAAYLAANLRNRPSTSAAASDAPVPRTTEERLAELQRLKDQGLVTDEEYDAHRKAILGAV